MWSVLKFPVVVLIVCGAIKAQSEDLMCHVCNPCGDKIDWTVDFCPPQATSTESTTLHAGTQAAIDPSYHCFKISRRDSENGTLIFERGCIGVPYEAAACDILAQDGEQLASCKVCGRPFCNAVAGQFQVSAILMVGGLLSMKIR